MRSLTASLLTAAVAMFVAAGCEHASPPGGPGAQNATSKSTAVGLGQPDNTFELKVPALSTSLKQGESKTIDVSIKRGKNFDQDVTLEFSGGPQGVKVTPSDNVLRHNVDKLMVTLQAMPDAALGEHTIKVTGLPAKSGERTSAEFKIKVEKP